MIDLTSQHAVWLQDFVEKRRISRQACIGLAWAIAHAKPNQVAYLRQVDTLKI